MFGKFRVQQVLSRNANDPAFADPRNNKLCRVGLPLVSPKRKRGLLDGGRNFVVIDASIPSLNTWASL
jgi:hypothetical protein